MYSVLASSFFSVVWLAAILSGSVVTMLAALGGTGLAATMLMEIRSEIK
jgi:hypothetical protein